MASVKDYLVLLDQIQNEFRLDPAKVGIVVVDHGSRREESNALLEEVVAMFRKVSHMPLVEPAHMELAEPSIAAAFSRCVELGAEMVVVFPYFLSPGRHWSQDIPRLAEEAAKSHPGIRYQVTSPLGLHDLMGQVMCERIEHCLHHSLHEADACNLCAPSDSCRMQDPSQST